MADVSQLKINNTTYDIKDKTARSAIANLPNSMIFKGTVGTNGTITSLPTASTSTVGYVYKVITAGTYASIAAKVGDVFICSDTPAWVIVPSGDEPSGTVTNVATGTGLTGGPITTSGTISLSSSGVTAGTYQGLTVDAYGRVTKASNMGYTTNTGTVTGIKMNGASKGTSGVVDLGTVITSIPTASSSTLGAVKTGSNITNSDGEISLTKDNVTSALGYTPPATDTTYTAGYGLNMTGNALSVKDWGYSTVITGDGSTTSFTVTHNLGSIKVIVQVCDDSDGSEILVDISRRANSVTLTFGTAPAASENYRVIIAKVDYFYLD